MEIAFSSADNAVLTRNGLPLEYCPGNDCEHCGECGTPAKLKVTFSGVNGCSCRSVLGDGVVVSGSIDGVYEIKQRATVA